MLSQEFTMHLRTMTRALYVVVDEEDRFITQFHAKMKKHEEHIWVYNAAFGLKPIVSMIEDWKNKAHAVDKATHQFNDALVKIYQDVPNSKANFYLITDPERWFKEEHMVRRILNILHQGHQDIHAVKCLIFVGHRRYVPEKLQRYIEVVNETDISGDEVMETVTKLSEYLKAPVPVNSKALFHGMTTYEIEASMSQSVVVSRIKSYPRDVRIVDPEFIGQYKRSQIKKTDLIQLVDSTGISFESIGGAQRFKTWARKTKSCWTEEGQKFGLTPPRGVLLMGVYGCGKSLSAKALANEWGLPLIQFEMGRIRSSAVGESESNLYKALRIIDSIAPAIVWIDEAEKSLAGAHSSSYSDAGTTSRLLGILSTWTQESKVPVCLVLTANNLKTLPTEMVNRLPRRFFFDLPNEEDRVDIIKIHAKKMGQDVSSFGLAQLADLAKNLVGREIEQAMQAAMVESFHQKKAALDESVLAAELTSKPRIITTMDDEINEIVKWVGYDKNADDGVRASLAANHRSEHFCFVSGS